MQKIQSFTVNHLTLNPGLYISRVDGDVTTYDLRTKKPNCNDLMDNETMHTCEHMLATYIRNSDIGQDVIYFGPMGCQTGFYLLVRNADHKKVIETLKICLKQVLNHTGDVFGNSEIECGNCRTLNLEKAKEQCAKYLEVMQNVSENTLIYEE